MARIAARHCSHRFSKRVRPSQGDGKISRYTMRGLQSEKRKSRNILPAFTRPSARTSGLALSRDHVGDARDDLGCRQLSGWL